jgi:phospholipid/cholesterol/gamma-HCH transport system substrate-binding protein
VRSSRQVARVISVATVVAAALVAAYVLLGGGQGSGYTVKARFQNASQLVKGNLVQVSGEEVGKVRDIQLTSDGQAQVTLFIEKGFAPLRRGTQITVRQASLSGIANRYLDLRLAPQSAPAIPDGGLVEQDSTTTAVDLDQLFNTFDPDTRKALQEVIRGFGAQNKGRGKEINAGLLYLNPSLAASSRLFRELNRDNGLLERFIVSSSQLVTDVADRRDDLAGLVDKLATTTTAIGDEQSSLAEAIQRLPAFMRRADTTFLNLRAALDDLQPLVDDSKPVAKKLRPLLAQLRPLAQDARPTLRDLSRIIRRSGANNDLVELTRAQVPVRNVAVGPVTANGKQREGALPASTKALAGTTPEISFFRPYSADFIGWLDDFSHSGMYDALGGVSRAGLHASAFMFLSGQLVAVPPELRDAAFGATANRRQDNRCPGGAEHVADDKSNPWKPTPEFNCDPTQQLPGS